MSGATETPVFETHRFLDDGVVPNNPALPLVHYRGVLPEGGDRASYCEKLFAAHGWPDGDASLSSREHPILRRAGPEGPATRDARRPHEHAQDRAET